MEGHIIVDSSFSAIINAPLEEIDIPSWASAYRTMSIKAVDPLISQPDDTCPGTFHDVHGVVFDLPHHHVMVTDRLGNCSQRDASFYGSPGNAPNSGGGTRRLDAAS